MGGYHVARLVATPVGLHADVVAAVDSSPVVRRMTISRHAHRLCQRDSVAADAELTLCRRQATDTNNGIPRPAAKIHTEARGGVLRFGRVALTAVV